MKKMFVFMLLMMVSTLAFGQTSPSASPNYCADVGQAAKTLNLTQDQTNKLQDQCNKAGEITASAVFTDKVKAIGEGIGLAIGETAKQLNVAANDFIKSPAGIITVSIIVAKMFGGAIIQFICLGLIWLVFTKLYVWIVRRVFDYKVEYTITPVLFGLWQRKKALNTTYKSLEDFEDGNYGVLALTSLTYAGASALCICNMF
jgi:hypothetical protein